MHVRTVRDVASFLITSAVTIHLTLVGNASLRRSTSIQNLEEGFDTSVVDNVNNQPPLDNLNECQYCRASHNDQTILDKLFELNDMYVYLNSR